MKTKVSEASGPVLDWMVKTAAGFSFDGKIWSDGRGYYYLHSDSPSTNWSQGGRIIEREKISTSYDGYWVYDPTDPEDNGERWFAEDPGGRCNSYCRYGPTPLIAAMRCYVASKLGDDVEIPKELAP